MRSRWGVVARGCKPKRRVIGAADATAAIDEGIEHQIEELVGELERDLLRSGRGFTGKLVQRMVRLLPERLKSDTKAGGSAPPLLKKLSMAWPTLSSLTVKLGSGGAGETEAAAPVVAVWVLWSAVLAALVREQAGP